MVQLSGNIFVPSIGYDDDDDDDDDSATECQNIRSKESFRRVVQLAARDSDSLVKNRKEIRSASMTCKTAS